MVLEGQTLDRLEDRRPHVGEGALHKTIALGAEDNANAGAHQHEGKKDLHVNPRLEHRTPFDLPSEIVYPVAEKLRQHHLDRDVHQQKAQTTGDTARVSPQKSERPEQIARFEPRLSWKLVRHRLTSFARPGAHVKTKGVNCLLGRRSPVEAEFDPSQRGRRPGRPTGLTQLINTCAACCEAARNASRIGVGFPCQNMPNDTDGKSSNGRARSSGRCFFFGTAIDSPMP